jgi:hypothetical protein
MIARRGEVVRRHGSPVSAPGALRRPLPPDLIRRIDADPLFQVMTSDHQNWIDPFTGTPVPASLGRTQAAKEYLFESGVWRDKEPLPRSSIETIRWRLELMRLLPIEPRLRIFGRDGRGWLNPFSGELTADINREDGKITVRTVLAMARALSVCPQAQFGRLLDNQTLMARVQSLGLNQQGAQKSSTGTGPFPSLSGGQELSDDMTRAKNVQQHMLPDLPNIDGFEIAVHYTAHAGVSGDFYDVIKLGDGRLMLFLGDVSGHGMQAALVVATALKTLRFLTRQTSDLVTLLAQFNDELKVDLLPGQFITLFAAMLDPETHHLTCVRAGHHPGLIANPDHNLILRKVGHQGLAIGLMAGKGFVQSLRPEVVSLQPGDVLLQYTDGVTEASDSQQMEFGDSRLFSSFLGHIDHSMQEIVDGIASDVRAYAHGNVADDLTIMALAVFGPEEDDGGDPRSDSSAGE